MRLLTRFILLLICLASRKDLVTAMRKVPTPGWITLWPGDFYDKRFRLHDCAVVYAWPSTGGRLELQNPTPFELDTLGIEDHFSECKKSTDPVEEDAFALRLRRLGGTFYEQEYGRKVGENLAADLYTWLGWPEDDEHRGGVWVLQVPKNGTMKRQTGRIRLAKSMQDRCRAIKMCGGIFHATPSEEHLVPIEHVLHPCGIDAQEYGRRQREAVTFQP